MEVASVKLIHGSEYSILFSLVLRQCCISHFSDLTRVVSTYTSARTRISLSFGSPPVYFYRIYYNVITKFGLDRTIKILSVECRVNVATAGTQVCGFASAGVARCRRGVLGWDMDCVNTAQDLGIAVTSPQSSPVVATASLVTVTSVAVVVRKVSQCDVASVTHHPLF